MFKKTNSTLTYWLTILTIVAFSDFFTAFLSILDQVLWDVGTRWELGEPGVVDEAQES